MGKLELLRFPLLFGTLISVLGVGFVYRDKWMGDIELERSRLYKQNIETDLMLEELKKQYKK